MAPRLNGSEFWGRKSWWRSRLGSRPPSEGVRSGLGMPPPFEVSLRRCDELRGVWAYLAGSAERRTEPLAPRLGRPFSPKTVRPSRSPQPTHQSRDRAHARGEKRDSTLAGVSGRNSRPREHARPGAPVAPHLTWSHLLAVSQRGKGRLRGVRCFLGSRPTPFPLPARTRAVLVTQLRLAVGVPCLRGDG